MGALWIFATGRPRTDGSRPGRTSRASSHRAEWQSVALAVVSVVVIGGDGPWSGRSVFKLAMTGHRYEAVYQHFLGLFMASLRGSPAFVTLIAATLFFVYAVARGVPLAWELLSAGLLARCRLCWPRIIQRRSQASLAGTVSWFATAPTWMARSSAWWYGWAGRGGGVMPSFGKASRALTTSYWGWFSSRWRWPSV
jgi:hypothetical protein